MSEATVATAVRERPILFAGRLVRAIVDGRKTQTRRVITGFEIRGPHGPFPPGLFDAYRLKGGAVMRVRLCPAHANTKGERRMRALAAKVGA